MGPVAASTTTVPPLSIWPLLLLAHSRAVAPCLLMARVWSGRGTRRTRSVVIRVLTRMINEAFWGPRKFLFCWGPEEQGINGWVHLPKLILGSCPIFLPACQAGAAIITAFSHQNLDSSIWSCGLREGEHLRNPGAGHWPLGGGPHTTWTPIREPTSASSSETKPR